MDNQDLMATLALQDLKDRQVLLDPSDNLVIEVLPGLMVSQETLVL